MRTILLFALLAIAASAQSTQPPKLSEVLDYNSFPAGKPAFNALFPEAVLSTQTPLIIRYVVMITASVYEVNSACEKGALSFFGTDDEIPEAFCGDDKIVVSSYVIHKVLAEQFARRGAFYGRWLESLGLEPFSTSMDKSTKIGWANVCAKRLNEYFSRDGWNSLGDLTKNHYRQVYQDWSGYKPQNDPTLMPEELDRPLRWQPLMQAVDDRGNYASQLHVVPHIGPLAKPLLFTREDFDTKKVPGPYSTPDKEGALSKKDTEIMRKQIDKLFETNAKVTPEQVASSFWWENKLASLGFFIGYYHSIYQFPRRFLDRILLSEAVAQHDATMLAWKEKVRHDLVRPTTMIRRLYKGKMVRAYKGWGKGAGVVKAEEWEPLLKIQPHSEYPSGSASICQASLDHLEAALKDFVPANETIAPFDFELQPFVNLFTGDVMEKPVTPIEFPVRLFFPTPQDAAIDCGMSRLYAGVHFEPSVMNGFVLAMDVGDKSFEHFKHLDIGVVPEDCVRCRGAEPIKM